jgi:UDP:flavonoid glycosyltransferase YjiC (YdhE family)
LPGHFRPLVPIAKRLAELGHEVLVASAPFFVSTVGSYGFDAAPVGASQPLDLDAALSGLGDHLTGQAAAERVEVSVLADYTARAAFADLVNLVLEYRPDVVVRDSAEFAGYLAAEKLGLPHVTVDSCLATSLYSRRYLFCQTLNQLRLEVGLSLDESCESLFRYLTVEFMPPEFFTQADELSPTASFFQQTNVVGPTDLPPPWLGSLPDRPTVLLNLGTLARQPTLLMGMYRALRDGAITLILKYNAEDAAPFRRLKSSHVFAGSDISPTAVLPACDLFITHAGYNGVKEAIRCGVPMLLVPQFGDQPFIAKRCEVLGIGKIVDSHCSADELRKTLAEALDDALLHANVASLRARMLAQPHRLGTD